MENMIFFYKEPFLTYEGLAVIGGAAAVLCGVLLSIHFGFGRKGLARVLLTAAASMAAGAVVTKLFGMLSRALYEHSLGNALSFSGLWEKSGIVFYGGLLGWFGMLAILIPRVFPKKRRLMWDMMATCTPLFHGIARLGCYCSTRVVDGVMYWHPCCYGKRMDNAFCAHFWDSRLPTQLIESAFQFLLFGVLLTLLLRRRERWRGKLITVFLIAYPVFRYLVEFFRDDAVRGKVGPFSFSQLISLLILIGVWLTAVLRQKGLAKSVPPDEEEESAARCEHETVEET